MRRADDVDWQDEHCAAHADPRRTWTPELALLRALLDQSCADLRDADPAIQVEARAWFNSDATAAFSFVYVTDYLGIDRRAFLTRLEGLVGGICSRRRAMVRHYAQARGRIAA